MTSFTSDLIFSLNATVPIFLMMVLGFVLRKLKVFDENTSLKLSNFSFRILLPALLFMDLSGADFVSIWDTKFFLFCVFVTLLSITIAGVISVFHKNRSERGEIIQASFRSSAAVLGIAFVNNIYGSSQMASLMIIGTVPIYNIVSVIVLSVTSPDKASCGSTKELVAKTLKNVAKNPIILGIAAGIIWSVLDIPQPEIMERSISYVGRMASPMSLIALGALFKTADARSKFGISAVITFTKLVLFCAAFLPVAVMLGFRGEQLVAILVMLGSATTASCFVMAKSMGHEGTITSCSVMLTTLLSSFTLTMWLFVMKTLNYI